MLGEAETETDRIMHEPYTSVEAAASAVLATIDELLAQAEAAPTR